MEVFGRWYHDMINLAVFWMEDDPIIIDESISVEKKEMCNHTILFASNACQSSESTTSKGFPESWVIDSKSSGWSSKSLVTDTALISLG